MRSRLPSRPNRMSLAGAGKVSSSPTKEGPARRKQDGPFGGMNMREAKIRGVPERPSAAQERRTSRHDRGDKDDKKSRGFHALKMQRALAPAHVPTAVQRIAVPALLADQQKKVKTGEGEQFLIAAETGSGKTLSYLIPTINAIKIAEAKDAEVEAYEKELREEKLRQNDLTLVSPPLSNMPHPTTGRPRAIILVPTSELVTQVGTLVKAFSHTVKFRGAMISSNFSGKVIRNRLFSPSGIDILVSTPHLLSSIADSDPNILSRVTHLIVDEADSLLDRGFSPLTSAIIDRATPSLEQLVLCSATIPHTIWSIGKAAADHEGPIKGLMDVKRILVFVNEREKAQEVADYLETKGIDAIALSRDTPEQRQSEMLASFTSPSRLSMANYGSHPGSLSDNQPNYVPFGKVAPPVKKRLPNTKVLVTTDLGSRGIDTVAVRHVILYDVPHSTIDFIHRLGRTGRMGRRGRGIVLVGKGDRRDVVKEVREGMFEGKALI
ncbi:hypothetical protein DID88_002123 [Monilinia fructigena]|uniref:RNA helicase n=1 Tax=Monilinia fructigena TaxID=38457 RepID=A0A395IVQ2_9HELO|nr:hypothetical protein DID88_002123 [Monilinia fructigena]